MDAIISGLEFVCVEERVGQNGKYWLYTFLSNGKLTPALYSKEKFLVDGVKKCDVKVNIGSYQGNLNMRLTDVCSVK